MSWSEGGRSVSVIFRKCAKGSEVKVWWRRAVRKAFTAGVSGKTFAGAGELKARAETWTREGASS
jgi:hypothetical protein